MIKMIKIENFKCFKGSFLLELTNGINILVGNNETGKSTILEAIHLALSGVFRGKTITSNLTQYLFNYDVICEYIDDVNSGNAPEPPRIMIELYFDDSYPILEGDNFTEAIYAGKNHGIGLTISLDEKYNEEYESLVNLGNLESLPIEYYCVDWYSFARKPLTGRSIPIKSAFIDVGFSKFQNGSDVYISRIVQNILETDEKIKVAQAYRKVKENFSKDSVIEDINAKITGISKLSEKSIELAVDLGSKSTWEGSLITQLDKIPFDYVGKGEQAIIKTDLALSNRRTETSSVVLIEEPECHVSHTRLNQLLRSIKENYGGKQMIISTHSSFVSNKLGLDNLVLLTKNNSVRLRGLESNDFFEKISGYDTLRLILCKKAILVEGDSDELVIQRAYMDKHDGKLPIEDGVEVISVGTSFLRFLEIGRKLNIPVKIVVDNDGDIAALQEKYSEYIGTNVSSNIEVCFDLKEYSGELKIGKNNTPYNYNTLEPLLLESNSLEVLNEIFGTSYAEKDDLRKYMRNHKTDCALKIFKARTKINYPDYIARAVK